MIPVHTYLSRWWRTRNVELGSVSSFEVALLHPAAEVVVPRAMIPPFVFRTLLSGGKWFLALILCCFVFDGVTAMVEGTTVLWAR